MHEPIRAEIRGNIYHAGAISATSLSSLCLQLLKAGYDPDASVEAYRDGRSVWDIRAVAIRAAAAQARGCDDDLDGAGTTPRRKSLTSDASAAQSGGLQKGPPIYKAENLIWHGFKLRLRSSNRDLAIIRPDAATNLFRVHLAPDHITDLLNLVRAKDAAVGLALAILNREDLHKRQRTRRKVAA